MRRRPGSGLLPFATAVAFAVGVLPLWLSSREMWDGVIGVHALAHHDMEALSHWLLDSNWYLTWGLLQAGQSSELGLGLPLWIACKAWISALAIGIAWQASRLARDLFAVEQETAAWIVPLVLAFPVWPVFFSFTSMLGHVTCVFLALLGYRWYLRSSRAWSLAGLGLLAVSVQLPSTGPFLIALEAGRWWLGRPAGHRSVARALMLVAVCILVFAATRLVWPPQAQYTAYNQIRSPLAAASWATYVRTAAMFATWGLLLLPAIAAFAVGRSRGGSARPALVILAVAAAACVPYVVVAAGAPLVAPAAGGASVSAMLASIDAGPWPITVWHGGWGARHMLLLMVPLAWLAVLLAHHSRYPVRALAATVLLLLAFTAPGHWAKLRRLAQEASVVNLLRSLPAPPGGKLDLLVARPVDYLNTLYESNSLLERAYGRTAWASYMLPDRPDLIAWAQADRDTVLSNPRHDLVRSQQLMEQYDWSRQCRTQAHLSVPRLSVADVLWAAEHAPQALPRATLGQVASDCPDAPASWRSR